jgi:hypothetical protein
VCTLQGAWGTLQKTAQRGQHKGCCVYPGPGWVRVIFTLSPLLLLRGRGLVEFMRLYAGKLTLSLTSPFPLCALGNQVLDRDPPCEFHILGPKRRGRKKGSSRNTGVYELYPNSEQVVSQTLSLCTNVLFSTSVLAREPSRDAWLRLCGSA